MASTYAPTYSATVLPLSVNLTHSNDALDLERHARLVPASATARGVFFNLARDALVRANLEHVIASFPTLFQRRKAFESRPIRELLRVYAHAGALLHDDPVQGVAMIAKQGSPTFARSWLGDRFRNLIVPDPIRPLCWIERSRDYLCNYGYWRLERRSPRYAVLHMFDEYLWIEPWQRSGCEGLLQACRVEGSVESELTGRFQGRLHIRWD